MAKRRRPHGNLRRSQLITTFGPGSMMDLPDHSVLVGGLDHWSHHRQEIFESRLLDKLKIATGLSELQLFGPPTAEGEFDDSQTGITCWQFPEWFVTQKPIKDAVQTSGDSRPSYRSRRLVHRRGLSDNRYIDSDNRKHVVVPVRFVRACRYGHIGDIDWFSFVHQGAENTCRRDSWTLWMDELDTSGDISAIQIRCSCDARRRLKEAVGFSTQALGKCDGKMPWLGPFEQTDCNQPNRLLIRSASNAYFSQKLSVISLPKRNEQVQDAVNQVWTNLEAVEEIQDVQYERRKSAVRAVISDFSDDEILDAIQEKRNEGSGPEKTVKQAELETLISAQEELGNDKPDGDFYARTYPKRHWDQPWMQGIERIVLVHRLREVIAQIGFTRFEAASPDIDGELELGVQPAQIASEMTWVPAIENRGEGIFIQFDTAAVQTWAARNDVKIYGNKLLSGFERWQKEHPSANREFPGLPFYMLHTFAHLLITSISLECGYPASSLRERVYSIKDVGYGVLIYTGSNDSEGTLGGLIETGRSIANHVKRALEYGEVCSNDPICGTHEPENPHEERFLQGAACHGCLLISETSCEQFNDFLDRALVVPTLGDNDIEFFQVTE